MYVSLQQHAPVEVGGQRPDTAPTTPRVFSAAPRHRVEVEVTAGGAPNAAALPNLVISLFSPTPEL